MHILAPIEWAVAWIIYGSHRLFTMFGLGEGPGWAWILSIVALTIAIRILLIPLFVKQIKASRGMQLMQPEMQAIQAKYKDKKDPESRQAMTQETMELYKKHGTNPMSSCFPVLLQTPIFFGLFNVLRALPQIADGTRGPIGPITQQLAHDIQTSSLFGAHVSDVFRDAASTQSRIVVGVLIALMTLTMYLTQRQLTMKNMAPSALEGPMAGTQKMMLYMMPLIFAISGINFPVGVLIYWTVSQLWSMGQQYYTIKKMPAPGSAAERELNERRARKSGGGGIPFLSAVTGNPANSDDSGIISSTIIDDDNSDKIVIDGVGGQRVQPVRKNRKKKG
jgi:YidC/Oxa1 family membrane protein insertase